MDLYLSYAERGRTAWWRYLLTILVGVVLAILALALFSLVLGMLRLLPRDLAHQLQSPSDPWMFFAAIAIIFASLSGGFAAAAVLIQRKRAADIIGDWRWSLFAWGAAVLLAIQVVLSGLDFALAPAGFSAAGHGTPLLALWVLGALLVQTFSEEFIFRGFITQGIVLVLRRPLPAACVSGLVFGALHIPNGWPQAINAAWFGIVCAFLAIRTGGIALTSGIHLANNYFGAMGVVSGGDIFKGSPGLFVQNTPQLTWWDLSLSVLAIAILPWLFRRLGILPGAAKA